MRSGLGSFYISHIFLLSLSIATLRFCLAAPSLGGRSTQDLSLPLVFYEGPAPSPEDGPPGSANALRDTRYLPAQIGGIVGSYAFALVLVASLLLVLSGRRREHLRNGDGVDRLVETTFNPFPDGLYPTEWTAEYLTQLQQFEQSNGAPGSPASPRSFYRNFSLPTNTSPISPTKSVQTYPSPTSTTITHFAPGVDLTVDQSVVQQDREMAQQQLEDMYKFVMEREEAKEQGKDYDGPPLTSPSARSLGSSSAVPAPPQGVLKKEKSKPTSLNLAKEEKKSSSFLSMLKSPRRNKAPKGISISSPVGLTTPMSATFHRQEEQEMSSIPPRHYNPPPPPPVPTSTLPFRRNTQNLPTPDVSPDSTQTIDERIDAAFGKPQPKTKLKPAPIATVERRSRDNKETSHRRDRSIGSESDGDGEVDGAPEQEPVSAVSERSEKSTSGLVGLPTSPKPGVNRFPSLASLPSLPATPRSPGMGFQRMNPPPAVRTGGALPLRAYEPNLASPSMASQTTKQTVFTRVGPLSPHGMRTPFTGAPVPYTPYQPFSPVVPITPSLVTREDRKRMRRLEPKTPTVEMVKSSDDLW